MDVIASLTYLPVRLSRNPIQVTIPALATGLVTNRADLRYFLKLFVPALYQSGQFQELTTLLGSETPPYTQGGQTLYPGATFEIQEQLDGFLKLNPPTVGQTALSVCPNLTMPYFTRAVRQYEGVQVDSRDSATAWVLKAGVDERDFSDWGDRLLTEPLGKAGRFLTWQPDGKLVQPESPEYLYFLTNFSPLPSELKLRVLVTYTDLTTERFTAQTLPGISAFSVYCVPVGPGYLGLYGKPKTVLSYQVWLNNHEDERVSEIRSYVMDTQYRRSVRHLLFSGSLGNFDTLTFLGKTSETLSVTRQLADRYPADDYRPTYAERLVNDATGERELTVSTGWITRTQADYLTELLLLREVYLFTYRAHLPLVPTNDTLVTSDDDVDLIGRTMTFTYANPQRNYSRLPIAPPRPARPTGWRPHDLGSCVLDASGKRTGYKRVSMLEKFYTDTGEAVNPLLIKPNVPGTEGYSDAVLSASCAVTPYLSARIERTGTFSRQGCGVGSSGGPALMVVMAGLYGSEISQADADAKAESTWQTLDTQAYANAHGVCNAGAQFYAITGVAADRFNFRFGTAGLGWWVAGGPSIDSQNPADVTYSTAWFSQDNANPASVIYPQGTNDAKLPTSASNYRIGISREGAGTVKVYLNGVLLDYKDHDWGSGSLLDWTPNWGMIPSQATVYVEVV